MYNYTTAIDIFDDTATNNHYVEMNKEYKARHVASGDFHMWRTYDNNGNVIHFKDSMGFQEKYIYDDKNNLIYQYNTNGDEYHHINITKIVADQMD